MAFLLLLSLVIPGTRDPAPDEVPRFVMSTVAGTGECGMSGDDGPALLAQIQRPTAVALDSLGYLYIADEANRRIRMVKPDGTITTVMGTGRAGGAQGRDLPALDTAIDSAYGIATDAEDNLYVSSRGHSRVYRIGEDGIARCIVGIGVAGFSGDGGPATEAQINYCNHMVLDSRGNLFLADTGNRRVRKVDPDGIITTVVGNGVMGFSGDGGPATEAQISGASAIAVDRHDNLYIADFQNHRIRKVTTDGVITTFAGNGKPKYNGEGQPATEGQFGEPCGVVVDEDDYVYIADQINLRVRVVTPAGRMYTVAGTGTQGREGDGGPAERAQTSNPDVIAVDLEGNLYIPDHLNCLVRKLTRLDG